MMYMWFLPSSAVGRRTPTTDGHFHCLDVLSAAAVVWGGLNYPFWSTCVTLWFCSTIRGQSGKCVASYRAGNRRDTHTQRQTSPAPVDGPGKLSNPLRQTISRRRVEGSAIRLMRPPLRTSLRRRRNTPQSNQLVVK